MPQSTPLHVLWEYNGWRCEYTPVTSERGVFSVFDGDVRVIKAECSPTVAVQDFAQSCLASVQETEPPPADELDDDPPELGSSAKSG